jgi:catechol 2,3-dioxygenase-like lactoylglutathione lyase family enzyme
VSSAYAGIDHVLVAAPLGCEEEARRFYGELLGLEEVAKPEALRASGGVWFACGEGQVHVGGTGNFAAARKAHPALRVSDAAALQRLAGRLLDAGRAVEWDDRLPGHRHFYVSDPWGNRLEFLARA